MLLSASLLATALCAATASALPAKDSCSAPAPPKHSLPSSFTWTSTGPLVGPKDDGRELAGIKDPSVVKINGTYHVFASTAKAEGYNLVYFNFTDPARAGDAPFAYLDQAPLGEGYRAAPQVFYFAPHKLWYLVYQDGNAAYSTNPDIGDPTGWTAPKHFYPEMPQIIADNIGEGYWVDMWVICDEQDCHLFSSDDNGHLYRSQTKITDFPEGMSEPVIALQDEDRFRLFEASCIYRIKGDGQGQGKGKGKGKGKGRNENKDQYLLLVEAIGTDSHRYYRSWTGESIDGEWTPLADTEENPFARSNNVVFDEGVEPWTMSISHGELVRTETDQTLTISPCNLEFMYQGMDPDAGDVEYNALPWRLAFIRQTNSLC
ncbi:hypothetical protein VTK26DRAFT_4359 [Humicola hyalothermophila]